MDTKKIKAERTLYGRAAKIAFELIGTLDLFYDIKISDQDPVWLANIRDASGDDDVHEYHIVCKTTRLPVGRAFVSTRTEIVHRFELSQRLLEDVDKHLRTVIDQLQVRSFIGAAGV
jgi:hypothetical protein